MWCACSGAENGKMECGHGIGNIAETVRAGQPRGVVSVRVRVQVVPGRREGAVHRPGQAPDTLHGRGGHQG